MGKGMPMRPDSVCGKGISNEGWGGNGPPLFYAGKAIEPLVDEKASALAEKLKHHNIAKDVLGLDFSLKTQDEIAYLSTIINIAYMLSVGAAEELQAIHDEGPTWDGNLISSSNLPELLDNDLVAKVVIKGEEGYTACTYRGKIALSIVEALKTLKNSS